MRTVPIWEKANLTLEEAAAYYGIGINKLRSLTDTDDCPYVLWVGKVSIPCNCSGIRGPDVV